jgi:fucose permease
MGGFSSLIWSSINTMAVDTSEELRGTVSSIINSFKYFSFSISPIVYGILYESYGIKSTFTAASGIMFIQLIIMKIYDRYIKKTAITNKSL